MQVYLEVIMLLNFLVDFLLLLGTNRLAGAPLNPGRAALAASIGSLYAGACLLPGFQFLGNLFWRLVFLGIMGTVSFGTCLASVRRCILFFLLSMALGGLASCMGTGNIFSLTVAAAVLCVLCLLGFQTKPGSRELVRVELTMGEKRVNLLALQDTGNTLRDPVTGQSVLVVSAKAAFALMGLTEAQLRTPVETVGSGKYPGLRLIPYRSVGQPAGMMAAIRLDDVTIGKWHGSSLVAFAPDGLDKEGAYQALTGGMV